jgi:T-complex protein 1 subunit eta
MIVRRCYKANVIVAGGGAIELELSRYLRHHARSISGKVQSIVNAYAKSLEVIPRTIAENAGLNSIEVMNKLRAKHAQGGDENKWFGVDVNSQLGIIDTYQSFVWEPTLVRRNALSSATEVPYFT